MAKILSRHPFICNESEEKLEEYLENLNIFYSNLKFTREKSKTSVNSLDVIVALIDQHYETDLYCKPTDCDQFLDFNSAHPIHLKKSIVKSQGLRIKRICSSNAASKNYFGYHLESLKGWFHNRGYHKTLVDNHLKRVTETRQISDQTYKRGNGVPLALTYHPRLKNVNDIIKKHLVFLFAKEQVENIFTPPSFVSFRAGFSLSKHLVRIKLYPLLSECVSSACDKSRCQTCLNVNNTEVFQSFVTKETYKINHKFSCDSICITFLFSCKACRLQYVGSTVEIFRFKWNNYKNCQREAVQGGTPPQSFFLQHFLREGHHGLGKDCLITLVGKTDSSDPTRQEFFLDKTPQNILLSWS